MKNHNTRQLVLSLILFCCISERSRADQWELFTYEVRGDTVEITDYPSDAIGDVEIPMEIEGLVVVAIGSHAFASVAGVTSISIPEGVARIGDSALAGCSALTSLSIPEGVIHIGPAAFHNCSSLRSIAIPSTVASIGGYTGFDYAGDDAFYGCRTLESIVVESGSSDYSSIDGVLYNAEQTLLMRCPEGWVGHCTVPSSVTRIAGGCADDDGFGFLFESAFLNCDQLTSVTIPGGVTAIGPVTFSGCTSLSAAVFLGDAPIIRGRSCGHHGGTSLAAFDDAAPGFTVYRLSSRTGFTSPTWEGYPVIEIDLAATPAAPWLLEHGFAYDTDLHQDLNGDGLSLLMAYALDLDLQQNLRGSLPVPIIDSETLTMSFHAASPGITYTVETSTDLRTWRTDGVILSGLDAENKRTATVSLDSPQRFLRLVVE